LRCKTASANHNDTSLCASNGGGDDDDDGDDDDAEAFVSFNHNTAMAV